MTSVTWNKVRGEFARSGLRGVLSSAIERPSRWVKAYRELGRHHSFDASADLLFYTRKLASGWFNPCQVDSEISALLDRVRDLRPKIVLEIGTENGGTLLMLTRVAAANATVISIDLPGGAFGGGYAKWRAPLYRRFALPRQKVELLRGDSHDPSMVESVRDIVDDRSVDFLFLDGDHTYEGVKRDHETYSRFVRPGGLIAFHDIQPIDDGRTQVPQYWREIRDDIRGTERIGSPDQRGYGIGYYEVGGA